MRILSILLFLCLCIPSADAQTYRAGEVNRANFGSSAQQEASSSSAPGAKSSIQTRTFSNYSSRQREWDKGVQTQGVRTETVTPKTFQEQVAQTDKAVDAIVSGGARPAAAANTAADGKKTAAAAPAPEKPAAASTDTASGVEAANAAAANAAAMSQIQNLMQSLQSLQQAAGAVGAGAASAGGNAAAAKASQQANNAVSAHSADISAFMNVGK